MVQHGDAFAFRSMRSPSVLDQMAGAAGGRQAFVNQEYKKKLSRVPRQVLVN